MSKAVKMIAAHNMMRIAMLAVSMLQTLEPVRFVIQAPPAVRGFVFGTATIIKGMYVF